MDAIKALFSTTGRAIATIVALLLTVAVFGTGIAFAAVWLDARGDAIEHSIEQKILGGTAPAVDAYEPEAAPEAAAPETAAPDTAVPETPANPPADSTAQNGGTYTPGVSQTQAEDIALKDAGITRADADNIFSQLEMDDGFYQYEVHIYKDLYEYEYNISADNGTIFEKDIDHIYD